MKTIEEVAAKLLILQIPFRYEKHSLTVSGSLHQQKVGFETATYHSTTKVLVLMDAEYNQVTSKI